MLADLPNELLCGIADCLESERDVNALARVDQKLFHLLDPYLYRRNGQQSGSSALRWAARHGRAGTARKAIRVGASVECREPAQQHGGRKVHHSIEDCSPLFQAITRGHSEIVEILLEVPALWMSITPTYEDGDSPLSYAAKVNGVVVVEALLRLDKVDADHKNSQGRTPLSLAAEAGNLDVTRLLLSSGRVEPDSVDRNRQTPFSWAALAGNAEMVKLIFEAGHGKVNPASRDKHGRTPLFHATTMSLQDKTARVLQALFEIKGVDPDSPDNEEMTPLAHAARFDNAMAVQVLLDSGRVNPNGTYRGIGRTALHGAAEMNSEEVVRVLLDHDDVDPNIADNDGHTPLTRAAIYDAEDIVRILLQSSRVTDHDCKDVDGRTPLWWAARKDRLSTGEVLLSHGRVDIDCEDNEGVTPLMVATNFGHTHFVKLMQQSTGKGMLGS
ncbi:uncharacterized protein DNG_06870 [Cephalotrichum gorgonifer]|uniref:Uncharacterized protein n=1 Tax=Cephalotrichum gorgonifer TaxID=2041049 RepID=A0AAE8SXQ3_9PEZI|nr:uncharacterized protein DNG_06870 [Cephalotrichum gorgonifer]